MTPTVPSIPALWLRGCKTPEERAARVDYVKRQKPFLDLLKEILLDRLEMVERKGLREEDYLDSNWVFLQAFRNGKVSELKELLEIM